MNTTRSDAPFAAALKRLMEQRGIGVRALAREMDSAEGGGTISNLLNGYASPSAAFIESAAKVLQVEPSHFAEYRLEEVRLQLEWRPPPGAAASARGRHLKRALASARTLGLDV